MKCTQCGVGYPTTYRKAGAPTLCDPCRLADIRGRWQQGETCTAIAKVHKVSRQRVGQLVEWAPARGTDAIANGSGRTLSPAVQKLKSNVSAAYAAYQRGRPIYFLADRCGMSIPDLERAMSQLDEFDPTQPFVKTQRLPLHHRLARWQAIVEDGIGRPQKEVCRKWGVSEPQYRTWRKKLGAR